MNSQAYQTFLRDLGMYLHLPAVLALPTLIVIIAFEEWFALPAFGLMALVSVGIGQLLYHSFRRTEETKQPFSLLLVSVVWLLIAIMGIIPFYGVSLSIPQPSPATEIFAEPINAFFESMSGFTGTGLTMVKDPSQLPHVLQWWRSLTEWIGGVGVVMLGMLFFDLRHDNEQLYQAETRNWTITDQDARTTVYRMWSIFIAYTVVSVAGFWFAGMPAWEALNHGMTGISTGGFAVTPDSFVGYSPTIKAVGTIIMLIGAFSFQIHYILAIRLSPLKVWRQTQFRYLLLLFVLAIGAVILINPETALVDNFFQVASALGTCGFNSAPLDNWSPPVLFLLIIMMVLGGNGSSTTGGIKTQRVAWLIKGIRWQIQKTWGQEGDPTVYYNKEPVENHKAKDHIYIAATILVLWLVAIGYGAFALTVMVGDRHDFIQILFDVASALDNVGLSAGVNGVDLPVGAKWVLISLMWMGRLEIFAVLMLISTPFWLWTRRKGSQ